MQLVISLTELITLLVTSLIQGNGWTLPGLQGMPIIWEFLPPASCMPDNCFCEPVTRGFIHQPVNTWSNLAFVLAGVLTMRLASRDFSSGSAQASGTNLMRTQSLYPLVYGLAAVFIGLGSMVYHGTLVFYAQVADILGMYLLSTFMVLYNLSRAYRLKGRVFLGSYLGINLALGIISTAWPEFRRPIFIAVLVLILLTELLARRLVPSQMSVKMLAAALASLVVACGAWLLDVNGILCMPNSWIQLHSLWHIAMAGAIWFLYLYYRSERPA
jgi:hypothetical protein